jgi:hypothetical protein
MLVLVKYASKGKFYYFQFLNLLKSHIFLINRNKFIFIKTSFQELLLCLCNV